MKTKLITLLTLVVLLLLREAWLVSQTPGTYLSIVTFGGAGDGTTDNATFMQAGVLAAEAAGGTLQFPCGVWLISTPVIVPSDVTLMGMGPYNCSVIKGTVVYASPTGGLNNRRGGARDIQFLGPGGAPPAGGSICVYLGGDPSSTLSPSAFGANQQTFFNVAVQGCDSGFKIGNNVYNDQFINLYIANNNYGLYEPTGITNSGSAMQFTGGIFLNNYTCAARTDPGQDDWQMIGTQFEFTKGWCGATVSLHFVGVHGENTADSGCSTCSPFININDSSVFAKIELINSTFNMHNASTQMFLLNVDRLVLTVPSITTYAGGALSEIFNIAVADTFVSQISVNNVAGDEANNIAAVFNSDSSFLQGLEYGVHPNATLQAGQKALQTVTPDPSGAYFTYGAAYAVNNTMASPPPFIVVKEPPGLSNHRASVGWFGDWFHEQDTALSGTRDFGLFNNRTNKLYQYQDPTTGHMCISINCSTGYNNYSLSIPPDSSNVVSMMMQDGTAQAGICQWNFFNNVLGSAVTICIGSGAPSINSPIGSLFLRRDGTTNQAVYINETGGGGGWVPVHPSANVISVAGKTGVVVLDFGDVTGTLAAARVSGLAAIATTGNFSDLIGFPTGFSGTFTCSMGTHVNSISATDGVVSGASCN